MKEVNGDDKTIQNANNNRKKKQKRKKISLQWMC